ncbi:MAG: tRNA (adenosine(37)-N6)-threonylcarbamoyltransferase complex ATPase subunit type 1 TsaE, partial [Proteobacteria bacterium]|nr:tRNA (adenosine(37)-N6)-threonylcarbamoyltransferase complex ATPase subunit type 1 TsaE [Pseudomonadota bacterium]
ALIGPLGSGKTVLASGIGAGLSVPTRVVSPTFVLLQAHFDGRLPFFHGDFYRLEEPRDLEQLGWEEAFESDGVCVVEWADRFVDALPEDHLRIEIAIIGDKRMLRIEAMGHSHRHLEDLLCR